MAAVIDRPRGKVYSLWLSSTLPSDNGTWTLLAESQDRNELEQKRRSLRPITPNKVMTIVDGRDSPYWRPRL